MAAHENPPSRKRKAPDTDTNTLEPCQCQREIWILEREEGYSSGNGTGVEREEWFFADEQTAKAARDRLIISVFGNFVGDFYGCGHTLSSHDTESAAQAKLLENPNAFALEHYADLMEWNEPHYDFCEESFIRIRRWYYPAIHTQLPDDIEKLSPTSPLIVVEPYGDDSESSS